METKRIDRTRWSQFLIPTTVLLASILATYYASLFSANINKEQFETRFQALANQTTLLIQEKLDRYPLLLKTTRGLVLNHLNDVEKHWPFYFEQAALDFEANGIIGITYTRYVPQSNRQMFVDIQRKIYGSDFRIFPDTLREDAFVLMHAAPDTITQKVRGFDIGSESNRRFAAERAKNSSSLALSEPISLLPTDQQSLDYLFLLPVESPDPNDPYTPLFHGWVTIGFSLSMLLEETLQKIDPLIHVEAVDERIGQKPLYDSHPAEQADSHLLPFRLKQTLELSHQRIDLYYTPLNGFASTDILYRHDLGTLIGGSLIGTLGAFACFLMLGGRARALRQAEVMTRLSRDSNSRYQALFESSPEAIILSVDNRIILANSSAVGLLGACGIEQLIGLNVLDIASDSNRTSADELMKSLQQSNHDKLPPIEEQLVRLDGSTFDAELSLSRTTYDNANATQLMFRDISDIKKRRNAAKIAKKVLEHTTEAIMVTDNNARIILTNPAFTALTGFTDKQALDQKTSLLKSGHHDINFYKQLWRDLLHTGQWIGEIANRKRSGEVYIQKTNISAVYDKGGDISHFVCVMSDITEQKRTFDTIRFQALHDNLTKLPNRIHFEARAEKALSRASHGGSHFAILFIDLDDFKPINDSFGHLLGDKLLVALADKLSAALRPSDMVSRIGGDEFLVLADELTHLDEARLLAERLMHMISTPVEIDDIELRVSASIGISIYPAQGDSIDSLIHAADQAMYSAKNQGKNQIAIASQDTTQLIPR